MLQFEVVYFYGVAVSACTIPQVDVLLQNKDSGLERWSYPITELHLMLILRIYQHDFTQYSAQIWELFLFGHDFTPQRDQVSNVILNTGTTLVYLLPTYRMQFYVWAWHYFLSLKKYEYCFYHTLFISFTFRSMCFISEKSSFFMFY
jgi:hypothetical protein